MTVIAPGAARSAGPFRSTADPDVFFENASTTDVFRRLRAAVEGGAPLAILTGEPGTGKTTLLRRLMGALAGAGWRTAVESLPVGLDDLRARLPVLEPGGRFAVGLDEAQALTRELLGSLEPLLAARPDVRVVLVGQPALEAKLAGLQARRVMLPAAVRCRLGALGAGDVAPYIEYRWRKAGGGDNPFSPAAVAQIAAVSDGIPQVINQIASRLLHLAEVKGRDRISAEMVDEVTGDLPRPAPSRRARYATPPGAARRSAMLRAALTAAVIVPLVIVTGDLVLRPAARGPERSSRLASARLEPGPFGPLRVASLAPEPPLVEWASDADRAPALPPASAAGPPPDVPAPQALPAPPPEAAALIAAAAAPALSPRPPAVPPPVVVARRDPQKDEALLRRAEYGDVRGIRALIAGGASPEARDSDGFTPLMLAIIHGHAAALDVLVEGGARVNAQNPAGLTPLMLAGISDHAALLGRLIDRGADPNQQTRAGWTALTYAAWRGHAEIVRLLLARGADPTVTDREGWTVLRYATWRAAEPIPRADLLDGAANGEAARVSGAGPGHREVIALLRQAGVTR